LLFGFVHVRWDFEGGAEEVECKGGRFGTASNSIKFGLKFNFKVQW
jgi:hypothetical protein